MRKLILVSILSFFIIFNTATAACKINDDAIENISRFKLNGKDFTLGFVKTNNAVFVYDSKCVQANSDETEKILEMYYIRKIADKIANTKLDVKTSEGFKEVISILKIAVLESKFIADNVGYDEQINKLIPAIKTGAHVAETADVVISWNNLKQKSAGLGEDISYNDAVEYKKELGRFIFSGISVYAIAATKEMSLIVTGTVIQLRDTELARGLKSFLNKHNLNVTSAIIDFSSEIIDTSVNLTSATLGYFFIEIPVKLTVENTNYHYNPDKSIIKRTEGFLQQLIYRFKIWLYSLFKI